MTKGKEEIKKITESIRDLPTLPIILERIMETLSDPNSTSRDLESVISIDQVVSAKVLALANSAFYGFSRQISKIYEATSLLGYNTVRNLALSVGIFSLMGKYSEGVVFDRARFWTHSVAVAFCSRILANHAFLADSESFFISGLLHDIGKVILDFLFPDQFGIVVKRILETGQFSRDAEKDVFDTDHAEVGAWLAEKWHFPKRLVFSINYHHHPEDAGTHCKTAAIICLADKLCVEAGFSTFQEPYQVIPEDISKDLNKYTALDEESIKVAQKELESQRELIEAYFSIVS